MSQPNASPPPASPPSPTPPAAGCSSCDQRRGFFARFTAILCGGTAVGVPVLSALASFLSPLREKSPGGRQIRVTTLDGLPDDGTPRKFPVIADRSDAWCRFANEAIGAVYLRKTGPKSVEAIQVVCPHAGCFVTYEASKKIYYCPCHQGSFSLDGKRLDAKSPSPRDLDTLTCEIRNGNEVWVTFENYRTGTSQKIVQA